MAYTKPHQRKKMRSYEEREIRSSLKAGKFQGQSKEEEGKMFHKLHALGMNDDLVECVE